jgi:ATP-dependent Clp protease ATP-binding subunit ClpA
VFDTFTEQARLAIERATREAAAMGHRDVRPEHLILGLMSNDESTTLTGVWEDFGLTLDRVRGVVRERVDQESPPVAGEPQFSQSAKAALTSAYRLGLSEPGEEHLLIALLARPESEASVTLRAAGVDPSQVRRETKKRARPLGETTPAPGEGGIVTGRGRQAFDDLDFTP